MAQNKKNKINKQKQQQFKEKTTITTKNADFIFFGISVSQYLFLNWFFCCVFFYFLNVFFENSKVNGCSSDSVMSVVFMFHFCISSLKKQC